MSSEFKGCSRPRGGCTLSEESIREEGFAIFKNGILRRLSPTHYVVKSQTANGWHLVELKDGIWTCDCNMDGAPCAHAYSTQLHRYASSQPQENSDEAHLRCRYCASIDIAGCGFRYGSRGISRRYLCHDCQALFTFWGTTKLKGQVSEDVPRSCRRNGEPLAFAVPDCRPCNRTPSDC